MVSMTAPPADWEEAILLGAVGFMNAEVCFYEIDGDDYDDATGTGGAEIRIIWRGKARVQQLRAPREASSEYQTSDSRAFRFQLDPRDSVPQLYSGAKARVLTGGRDAGLESLAFVVDSAINSSHMAVRTVDLTASMRPAKWSWFPDADTSPVTLTWPNEDTVTFSRLGDVVTAELRTVANGIPAYEVLTVPERFLPEEGRRFLTYNDPANPSLVLVVNTMAAVGEVGVSMTDLSPEIEKALTTSWVGRPIVVVN